MWNFKNFNEEEFACQHCGEKGIKLELVEKLQHLRDLYKNRKNKFWL